MALRAFARKKEKKRGRDRVFSHLDDLASVRLFVMDYTLHFSDQSPLHVAFGLRPKRVTKSQGAMR